MGILQYSDRVFQLREDYLYKYGRQFLNVNFRGHGVNETYRKPLSLTEVAIVSKQVAYPSNDTSKWGAFVRTTPVSMNEFSKKVRYEIRQGIKNFSYKEAYTFDDNEIAEIAEVFRKASERNQVPVSMENVEKYVNEVLSHAESRSARVFLAIHDGSIHGVALVNFLDAAKTINLKNLKVDYNRKTNGLVVGLLYTLLDAYSEYFHKGYVFHAGTVSIRHDTNFHNSILHSKLNFMYMRLDAKLVTPLITRPVWMLFLFALKTMTGRASATACLINELEVW